MTNSASDKLHEIAEKAAYSIYQASSSINFNWHFDCKTTVAWIILRAMQEAVEPWQEELSKANLNYFNWINEAKHRIADLRQQLDLAWGIIANAGGGDWSKESQEWQEVAAKWSKENNK